MSQQSKTMRRTGSHAAPAVLALVCAMSAMPAAALHPPEEGNAAAAPAAHIAFGAFYLDPDSTRGVDSGLGTNYGYGRAFWNTRAWELRLFGDTLETGVSGMTDFYQYGAGLDVFQYLGNLGAGHPYLVLGLGAVLNDVAPDEADGVGAYANAGVGWRGAPWRNWPIRHRVDLRAVYDTFEDGQLDVQLGLTLEIASGRSTEKLVEVERVVEVPAAVLDGDGDAIPDAFDKCPDTVAGAKVEGDGCVHKAQVVVLPNIEFALGRAELTPVGRETLGSVVRFMNDQPEIELEVWGHTDATGSELSNLRLSQRRSASAVKFLVENGIVAKRLKSAGFGESRPLADNETVEGRDRNRRVELNIRATRAGERP